MELLALGKPIKKPPRSDERDGELFCGTLPDSIQFTASRSTAGGTGGYTTISANLVNQYTYFKLSGGASAYYYYDSHYASVPLNTNLLIANYPCTDHAGFASASGSSAGILTLSN